jgi:regulator of nonsense transcripts 2
MKESTSEQETELHDNVPTSATERQLEVKVDDLVKESEDRDKEKGKDGEKEKSKEKDLDKKNEREKEKGRVLDGASLDNLLQRLPGCVSRDLIDQLTVFTHLIISVLFVIDCHNQATFDFPRLSFAT